jgi:hypothetical protein
MIKLLKDTKFIGEFVEERNGEKVLVKKWECVCPLTEHNSKLDALIEKAEEQRVSESVKVGKLAV